MDGFPDRTTHLIAGVAVRSGEIAGVVNRFAITSGAIFAPWLPGRGVHCARDIYTTAFFCLGLYAAFAFLTAAFFDAAGCFFGRSARFSAQRLLVAVRRRRWRTP